MHEIEDQRQRLLDIIKTFDSDTKLNDISDDEKNTLAKNTPPELVYKLSGDMMPEFGQVELLRFHYLNPFDLTVDSDTLQKGVTIMVNYDYYGDMPDEEIIKLLTPLSQQNKIRFLMKGQELGKESSDIGQNIINKLNNESLDTLDNLLLTLSDKPKYKYHIINKIHHLLKDQLPQLDEPLRLHELNIFDNTTSYDIVKEWLEVMKEEYYYRLDKDKLNSLLSKLNEDETNKIKEFFEQFSTSNAHELLSKISI